MSLKNLRFTEDEIYRVWCDECGEFVDATDLAPYSRNPYNQQGYSYDRCCSQCCGEPNIQVETLNEGLSCIACKRVLKPWENCFTSNFPNTNTVCVGCYEIAEKVVTA